MFEIAEMPRLIVLIVFLVAVTTLQTFLCRRQNRWIGFVLPVLFFALSILVIVGFIFNAINLVPEPLNFITIAFVSLQLFILFNLPTAALIGIYIFYHGRKV
jgi:hypothetical protein